MLARRRRGVREREPLAEEPVPLKAAIEGRWCDLVDLLDAKRELRGSANIM